MEGRAGWAGERERWAGRLVEENGEQVAGYRGDESSQGKQRVGGQEKQVV